MQKNSKIFYLGSKLSAMSRGLGDLRVSIWYLKIVCLCTTMSCSKRNINIFMLTFQLEHNISKSNCSKHHFSPSSGAKMILQVATHWCERFGENFYFFYSTLLHSGLKSENVGLRRTSLHCLPQGWNLEFSEFFSISRYRKSEIPGDEKKNYFLIW